MYTCDGAMKTIFPNVAIVLLVAGGCGRASEPPRPATPTTSGEREWRQIVVDGPYGTFEMPVPVLFLTTAEGGAGSMFVDSIALREIEKRLTARIARIARAEAAALMPDSGVDRIIKRNPAPPIKERLLGAVPFGARALEPTPEGVARIQAIAALLAKLAGGIEIYATAHGTGPALYDVANLRARHVYLALLTAEPALAEREVRLTIRTRLVLADAPVPDPVIEVYYTPQ